MLKEKLGRAAVVFIFTPNLLLPSMVSLANIAVFGYVIFSRLEINVNRPFLCVVFLGFWGVVSGVLWKTPLDFVIQDGVQFLLYTSISLLIIPNIIRGMSEENRDKIFMFGALFVAFYVLFEFCYTNFVSNKPLIFLHSEYLEYKSIFAGGYLRPRGLSAEPSETAMILGMSLFYLRNSLKLAYKITIYIAIVLMGSPLPLLFSTAYVMVSVWRNTISESPSIVSSAIKLILLAFVMIAVLAASVDFVNNLVQKSIMTKFSTQGDKFSSFDYRSYVYKNGSNYIFNESPIIGFGFGYTEYKSARKDSLGDYVFPGGMMSVPLQFYYFFGLGGVLLYLFLVFQCFRGVVEGQYSIYFFCLYALYFFVVGDWWSPFLGAALWGRKRKK
ncbi:O-antigen ligase family protein [Teredinibacter turnerae]|uniref:O-antigen ligase family protein n=1 Tax=Teredinibacter turnerae TaxID=2426 RepID=UPI000409F924|nr:O-antigen ligase family protein [Teredinibacter turnerae]